MTSTHYTINYAVKSDVGKRRSENQDTVGAFHYEDFGSSHIKGQLFIVADGMGGHDRGKEASETAVRVISESYFKNPSDDLPECLRTAFYRANEIIYNRAASHGDIQKMGTTCSALVVAGKRAYIAHVGDSRLYRITKSGIQKLTSDHTQVAEMYKRGILTKKEAKEHPSKSVLSRALGSQNEVEVDIIDDIDIHPGDNFLICTDGLAKVEKDEIKKIVLSQSPPSACSILVDYANQQGGEDNISVILVGIEKSEEDSISASLKIDAETEPKYRNSRRWVFLILLILSPVSFYIFDVGGLRSHRDTGVTEPIHVVDEKMRLTYKSAEEYFQRGKLDSALVLYRRILRENPLHIGSIEGIDKIADEFISRGDIYRDRGDFDNALNYYKMASELQPLNNDIQARIQTLGDPIRENTDYTGDENLPPAPAITDEDAKGYTEAFGEPHEDILRGTPQWTFPGLAESEFIQKPSGIRFMKSGAVKKAIYAEETEDVDISLEAQFTDKPEEGSIGIIIGYSDKQDSEYFLFAMDHSKTFKLLQISGQSHSVLVSITPDKNIVPADGVYRLKVKSLGPWLMLYKNNRMLQAWLHDDIIRGNIGVFADPDIEVEFSNIAIESALKTIVQ
jgi:PPM family protein phosphatase